MAIAYTQLNHPLRVPLAAEVHSRPFLRLQAPEVVTHLAVYARDDAHVGGDNVSTQQAILAAFCAHFGVASPSGDAKYFFYDFGRFRLKWECHTEFATYSFVENNTGLQAMSLSGLRFDQAFSQVPLRHLPQQWLLELRGKIMVATHVALLPAHAEMQDAASLRQIFEPGVLIGSGVLQRGEVWTDFLIQADGFSRFVVKDFGFLEQQPGRVVQRLLEIETYRMMALLGLPHAQRAAPVLNGIENELVSLTAAMTKNSGGQADTDAEQSMLHQITDLAAQVEKLSLENSYRFSASKAYFRLVQSRIDELREVRIEGMPTIEEFMDRRLAPAMNTCEAIMRRQETLAERIAHTNDLLRTRVGIVQEWQNRQILESMNKRAAQQLRLQQAVEGLSVAAITYYVAGLFQYGMKALKALGAPLNPELLTGLLIPVIAGVVWMGLRKLHQRMH
ncbi:MAG: DUF3422 domain-containing protein [Burkholderiales bacterium]|nr:DUF3422 domain-containing protein [Burkholderiales bacterium]